MREMRKTALICGYSVYAKKQPAVYTMNPLDWRIVKSVTSKGIKYRAVFEAFMQDIDARMQLNAKFAPTLFIA
jgi:DNA primase